MCLIQLNLSLSAAALDKAFRHFDTDNSGFLDKAEFKRVLTELGTAPMSDKEFKAVWKNVDENSDGKVSCRIGVCFPFVV